MAALDILLEVQTRQLNQYHRLKQFPVRIGRALDNDIILSDPTISAYHLEINEIDGELVLKNLSQENGTRINGQALQESRLDLTQPIQLRLGNRRLRLLRSDMEVSQTSVRNCGGLYVLFCRPAWSLTLVLMTLFAFLYESYLQTIFDKDLVYYVSSVLPYLMGMIAITLLAAGISRLSIQRWEIGAAVSVAALFMLIPHILGEIGHILNYFFTADWPLDSLILLSNYLLLPVLLYAYVRLVHHADFWPAMGIALLFSAPLLVYQTTELADEWTVSNEFTGQANFNRSLSSWDIRLQPTISIDDFMQSVSEQLPSAETAE